jgi:Family of unknown function (DUF6459)
MEQNPPPGLSPAEPEVPAGPVVIPMLPTRRRPAGRRAPLPDPMAAGPPALHRVPVPDSLPPYDGERGPRTTRSADRAGPAEDGPDPPAHEPGQAESKPDKPTPAGPVLAGRAVPGPGGWPSQFAQVLAETLAGSRPAQQLAPWTTEQTRQRIRELGPMMASGQRPRVRRVMTSAPTADVLELTAVVGFGARVRVLALRLERADDRTPGWQCTALESA